MAVLASLRCLERSSPGQKNRSNSKKTERTESVIRSLLQISSHFSNWLKHGLKLEVQQLCKERNDNAQSSLPAAPNRAQYFGIHRRKEYFKIEFLEVLL